MAVGFVVGNGLELGQERTYETEEGLLVREGYMPFRGYGTWYRIVGENDLGRLPLLTIHGGPGNTHWYLRSLDALAARYGRQVIYYDQLSCGYSVTPSLPDLWSAELFEEELHELRRYLGLERVHLLGQSWGGMLEMQYAAHRPSGVASMVVASSPADMGLWLSEAVRLRHYLPAEMDEALAQADVDGDYDRPEVKAASEEYYRRHVAAVPEGQRPANVRKPYPDPVGGEVYHTMQGMSEFVVTGKLSGWSVVDKLGDICIPTLVTSGTADECTPAISKQVADGIPGAEWALLPGTHCVHLEIPEQYNAVVEEFLERHE